MKRLFCILLSIGICAGLRAQSADSLYAALDSLLAQFYVTLEHESTDAKCDEADFLIGTCRDSLTRQHVALSIFDHYCDSRVMGEEGVAIHVYDTWFDSGVVKFRGEMDKLDAGVYVKFNRNSLIGCDAPVITLRKPCGGKMTIPESGTTSLLFFFDTSCAKCRLESAVMPQVLSDVDFRMNLYCIYCGADKKSWREFRRHFAIDNPMVKVRHFWDPEMDSDYQLQYSVTGTPRVFLVGPDGTIIGRRLEMESLMQLLPYAGAIQAVFERQGDEQ